MLRARGTTDASIGGGGDGVGAGIVNAIPGLAEGTPLDVDARVEDVRGDAVVRRRQISSRQDPGLQSGHSPGKVGDDNVSHLQV
mgnify:CR=1 FL=1